MSSGARLVAGALRNIASRQGARRRSFRWNSWSGTAVAALAGVAAASSLNRRKSNEEQLQLAEARVVRAEGTVDRIMDGLLTDTPAIAEEVATLRKPDVIERRLREWVAMAVEREKAEKVDAEKTSFV